MTGWRRTTGVVCALWAFSDLSWLAVESTAVWSAGRIGDKGGVVQTCGAAGGIGTLVWQHDEWWLKAIGINRILLCLKVPYIDRPLLRRQLPSAATPDIALRQTEAAMVPELHQLL